MTSSDSANAPLNDLPRETREGNGHENPVRLACIDGRANHWNGIWGTGAEEFGKTSALPTTAMWMRSLTFRRAVAPRSNKAKPNTDFRTDNA